MPASIVMADVGAHPQAPSAAPGVIKSAIKNANVDLRPMAPSASVPSSQAVAYPHAPAIPVPNQVGAVESASVINVSNPPVEGSDGVEMRSSNETVVGAGAGANAGGSTRNAVHSRKSDGSNLILSEGAGGDTVLTGAGNTTIQTTDSSK